MDQRDLIAAIGRVMTNKEAVRGLFLSGSFGRGSADEWSDVDLIAFAAPEDQSAVAEDWRDTLGAITPIVFWNELNQGGLIINAISEEWLRCDLAIMAPGDLGLCAKSNMKPLIDRDGVYATLRETLPPRKPNAGLVKYLIHEFIRMLGLMPVAVGRQEYVTMVLGVGMLRDHLTTLLMQDVIDPDPGGILHQSKVLPPTVMAMLAALPYPGPERDDLIAANVAIAREFMPRARAMAQRLDLVWPDAFEAATRRRLASTLGHDVGWGW